MRRLPSILMTFALTQIIGSSSVFASGSQPSGYDPVAEDKFDDYIRAVNQSFSQQPKAVQSCDSRWIGAVLNTPDEILIAQKSAQPLLLFNKFDPRNSNIMYRMALTTESNLKTLKEVWAQVYSLEEVNTGDLANPNYTEDWVLRSNVLCTVK